MLTSSNRLRSMNRADSRRELRVSRGLPNMKKPLGLMPREEVREIISLVFSRGTFLRYRLRILGSVLSIPYMICRQPPYLASRSFSSVVSSILAEQDHEIFPRNRLKARVTFLRCFSDMKRFESLNWTVFIP